jgi:hypothetical protein
MTYYVRRKNMKVNYLNENEIIVLLNFSNDSMEEKMEKLFRIENEKLKRRIKILEDTIEEIKKEIF